MKRVAYLIFITLTVAILFLPIEVLAQTTNLPYFCGFENASGDTDWTFRKRPGTPSEWSIGSAVSHFGQRSLYVSPDDGVTADYVETTAGYSVAVYKTFTLNPGTYDLMFDCMMKGETDRDIMRVVWAPATVSVGTSATGTSFPPYCTQYPFITNDGVQVFEASSWKTYTGPVTVSGTVPTAYNLIFIWKTNGGLNKAAPGACIDNIYLAEQVPPTACNAKPTNIACNNTANGVVVTWNGNATSYEMEYYSNTGDVTTGYNFVSPINATTYTIPQAGLPEGMYTVRVRAICDQDTSLWVTIDEDFLVYDPSAHCLDYLNFRASGVQCHIGDYEDPYSTQQIVDNGPSSMDSRHTVHYGVGEYDARTAGGLKTVPDGEVASVRLGNWNDGSEAESITYTLPIDQGSNLILLLKYACVLEEPGHEDEPGFKLEIMNMNNQVLSSCTQEFFWADVSLIGSNGWSQCKPEGASSDHYWKDWTSVGVNLSPYAGQSVKIRLTTYDCGWGAHFGYAYFTLNCLEAKISGLSCGAAVADQITAPTGFNYEWYNINNPSAIVSTDQSLSIASTDTSTYNCDVIYKGDASCRFTLTASLLPRMPKSSFTTTHTVENCQNIVRFNNTSRIYSNNNRTNEHCETFYWDFGDGTTSNKENPDQMRFPNEGGQYTVKLITGISDNICMDTIEVLLDIPPLAGAKEENITKYLCEGESVEVNGKTYTEAGLFSDTLVVASGTGCDSVININIEVLELDTALSTDTICDDQVISWYGQTINAPGVYTHTAISAGGCDSMYYEKTVTVYETLDVAFDVDTFTICADAAEYLMPYTVNKGNATGYQLKYGEGAETMGFESTLATDTMPIVAGDAAKIIMPLDSYTSGSDSVKYVRPGYYNANVTFYNAECGNKVYPVTFLVEYPSYVLAQRWKDVIALKNEGHNGGYKFSSYQWYKNSGSNTSFNVIPGATQPILYVGPTDTLDTNADYKVLVTREDDASQIFTCTIRPIVVVDDSMPTVTFGNGTKVLTSSAAGVASIYSVSGVLLSTFDIFEGETPVDMPLQAGVYILNVRFEDGTSSNSKIIVR